MLENKMAIYGQHLSHNQRDELIDAQRRAREETGNIDDSPERRVLEAFLEGLSEWCDRNLIDEARLSEELVEIAESAESEGVHIECMDDSPERRILENLFVGLAKWHRENIANETMEGKS
jgi:hypothetical protein